MRETVGLLVFVLIVTAFGVFIVVVAVKILDWALRIIGDLWDSWRWRIK